MIAEDGQRLAAMRFEPRGKGRQRSWSLDAGGRRSSLKGFAVTNPDAVVDRGERNEQVPAFAGIERKNGTRIRGPREIGEVGVGVKVVILVGSGYGHGEAGCDDGGTAMFAGPGPGDAIAASTKTG